MRKHIEWEDPGYIVRLVMQKVGEGTVERLKDWDRDYCDPQKLFDFCAPGLAVKVGDMNSETLGRIAAYATKLGNPHNLDDAKPRFINRTGLVDLCGHDSPAFVNGDLQPRGPLEMLAIATIVCVLRDIILQPKWSEDWDKGQMKDRRKETDSWSRWTRFWVRLRDSLFDGWAPD